MSGATEVRQRFGRYEVLFPIASGGMAEVFAARVIGEAGFTKLVALKRMRPELTDDVRFTTMFLDEGRVAAHIASPNVVSTLDLGRADDNSLYLVMELVTGASLATLSQESTLEQTPFPPEIAVAILRQAANGLHDAHEARSPAGEALGIIHRDVSPHNILVDVNGQAKITDFGIAKALERQTRSQAGEMKGKLSYLSPEQARGSDVDRRTDIFILGIVAWETLVGRRLFTGRGPVEVLHKIVTMDIPRVDAERPELPRAVGDAVEQALARDRDDRFSTALAFGEALGHALGQRLPGRAEVGTFVQRFGGDALRELQHGIRRAAGGSFDELPAEPEVAYPIPLRAKTEPPPPGDDPDAAAGTIPMSPLEMPDAVRAHLAPDAAVDGPAPDPRDSPPRDLRARIRADEALRADEVLRADEPLRVPPPPTPASDPSATQPPNTPLDTYPPPTTRRGLGIGVKSFLLILLAGGAITAAVLLIGSRGDAPATPAPSDGVRAATPSPTVSAPQGTAPEGAASDGTTADGTTSDGTASDGTTADGTTSDGTTSDGTSLEHEVVPVAPVPPSAEATAPTPAQPAEVAGGRQPRRRAAPRGEPPPRLTGSATGNEPPVGDREAAMREVFGDGPR